MVFTLCVTRHIVQSCANRLTYQFFERLALREAKKRRQPTEATEIDLRETLQIYVDTYGRHSFNPWYHPVDPTDADEDDDDDSKRTKQ
jgi:hypothetical protein